MDALKHGLQTRGYLGAWVHRKAGRDMPDKTVLKRRSCSWSWLEGTPAGSVTEDCMDRLEKIHMVRTRLTTETPLLRLLAKQAEADSLVEFVFFKVSRIPSWHPQRVYIPHPIWEHERGS